MRAISLSVGLAALSTSLAQENYVDIVADLQAGVSLEEVADGAYENSEE